MSSKILVQDQSAHSYFTQIPNIILDIGLSPGAITLYLYLKRIAGESGSCWKSIEGMSRDLGFSLNTIRKWKHELSLKNEMLEGLNLISIEKRAKDKEGRDQSDIIKIVDIWPVNVTILSLKRGGSKIEPRWVQKVKANKNPSKKGSLKNPSSHSNKSEIPNNSSCPSSSKQQQKKKVASAPVVVFSEEIEQQLSSLDGISSKFRKEIKETHSEDKIRIALDLTRQANADSPIAFFRQALKEGWKPNKPSNRKNKKNTEPTKKEEKTTCKAAEKILNNLNKEKELREKGFSEEDIVKQVYHESSLRRKKWSY